MTLTAPGCPVAGEMPGWVENAVSSVPGVSEAVVTDGLRSALGPVAHVRRGARRARHVVTAMPRLDRVLETALYVDDLSAGRAVLRGCARLGAADVDAACAPTTSAASSVLLLFRAAARCRPCICRGGTIPPHDGIGPVHLAFAVSAEELAGLGRAPARARH